MFPTRYSTPPLRIQLPILDCEFHVWYHQDFIRGVNVEVKIKSVRWKKHLFKESIMYNIYVLDLRRRQVNCKLYPMLQ